MLFGICPPQFHPHLQQKLKTANKLDLHLKKKRYFKSPTGIQHSYRIIYGEGKRYHALQMYLSS